jgi:hypothetical protein
MNQGNCMHWDSEGKRIRGVRRKIEHGRPTRKKLQSGTRKDAGAPFFAMHPAFILYPLPFGIQIRPAIHLPFKSSWSFASRAIRDGKERMGKRIAG